MADDPTGFFFNVEKFFGSVSCTRMSFAEKGVYLVMLFQQWRDKAKGLPDDPAAVAETIAVTAAQGAEVMAAWDVVRPKFVGCVQAPGRIYNVEIERTRRKQREYFRKRREAGRLGGKAKARNRQTVKEIDIKQCCSNAVATPSDQSRLDQSRSDQIRVEKKPEPADARSKRPIYTSDRFAVFEWQLDELGRILGSHLDAFDLHAFFDGLSQSSRLNGLVIPKADVWAWLQGQVIAEAKRRGLPMATVTTEPTNKRIAGLVAGGEAFLRRNQR